MAPFVSFLKTSSPAAVLSAAGLQDAGDNSVSAAS